MHTAESNFSNFVNWNQIQNYFSLFIRGLDGLESWEKKLEVENLVTHFL